MDKIDGRIDNIEEQENEKKKTDDKMKENRNDFKQSDCRRKSAPGEEVCQLQQTSEGDEQRLPELL